MKNGNEKEGGRYIERERERERDGEWVNLLIVNLMEGCTENEIKKNNMLKKGEKRRQIDR